MSNLDLRATDSDYLYKWFAQLSPMSDNSKTCVLSNCGKCLAMNRQSHSIVSCILSGLFLLLLRGFPASRTDPSLNRIEPKDSAWCSGGTRDWDWCRVELSGSVDCNRVALVPRFRVFNYKTYVFQRARMFLSLTVSRRDKRYYIY
jgi:hypothetical protein